jgi:hypothetical protein
VRLPAVLRAIVASHPASTGLVTAFALVVLVGAYLGYVLRQSNTRAVPGFILLAIWLVSSVAFSGLAYGNFWGYARVNPGINNRVAIAAALGVAFSIVALAGMVSLLVRRRGVRAGTFAVLIAVVSGVGWWINDTIASYWVHAFRNQHAILEDLGRRFAKPPATSAIFLDGFCPWIGPGVVFELNWDVTGALTLLYRDNTLRGGVIRPWITVSDQGIAYQNATYPFDSLYVYNVRTEEIARIRDAAAARRLLEESARNDVNGCLATKAFGVGLPIWPYGY